MATCLVTGGAGFIGSHLVDALLAQNHHVRILDNLSTGYLKNLPANGDLDFVEGDICDTNIVESAVKDVDFVFHLAALVSVPESMVNPAKAELVNAVGTLNLLQAAQNAGAKRLVLSSTCAVYGDEPTLPKTEVMRPYPKSPYAISKWAAEAYCRFFNDTSALETVILRYFNVFGPRQDPSSPYSGVISIFCDKLQQHIRPTIFGDGEQTRDFVYVSDVAKANMLAMTAPNAAGRCFNIGTGRSVTINQLFETLCRIFECNLEPEYKAARSGDIPHSRADAAQAKTILNWSPQISFEVGLQRLAHSLIDR